MLERLRVRDESTRWLLAGGLLALVVGIPMAVSGPGNDLDVGNVFRSGRAIARHLSYVPSRAPGAPVHELVVGVLDLVGGPLLTNLASIAAAIGLLLALDRLLAREGLGPGRRWALALVAANPWFLVAATSTADYVFALLFVVLAALALRSDRPVLAGALAAASMGCRIGSAFLVLALLLAELTEPRSPASSVAAGDTDAPTADRARSRRRAVVTAAVAAVVTAVLFIPSVVAAGGLAFAQNDFATSTLVVQLGRAAIKDLTLLGPVASVVLLFAVPALWAALRTWRTSWLVRFAVPGFVLSQALFVRFPWKMPHLLPCLLCLAVALAVALHRKPALLVGLVALQLLFCVVRLDLVQPDNPNEATGGKAGVGVGWGPVVTDWRCRREHPNAYLGRQKVEIEQAWDCAKPFGG
ncbi:hypothetical protein KSP35_19175 [Aquihabitans sp. G128]|uniref:hypothetical protein n=1 Tax=Aquihabitans sp. G128 TaxID=2849779 RepID=UPI001C21D09A|nr:hypothetical protein [Aquihabitans sp. G128]QXC60427.1 hypothetical protein KSP35_19175 [Aquihabitans sp. G128]